MDITKLAEDLAAQFDITPESAEETAEIYLRQIETIDGRTIDRDDISDDDAEAVATAIDAGSESSTEDDQLASELMDISEQIRDRQDQLDQMTARRNEIVVRLLDRANSVRSICEWSGLSRARVYAIKDGR